MMREQTNGQGQVTDVRRQQRAAVVRAALVHIPFDGWSMAALKAGARDAGLSPSCVPGLFPTGVREAVALYVQLADADMIAAMAEHDVGTLKIRERIKTAIKVRLHAAASHRDAVRGAVSMLSMPCHAGLSLKLTAGTVDAMWRACADRSVDFNWYTKRALLAGVYGSTLLYWLEDKSDGFEETWGFLDRRIEDIMRIPKIKARFSKVGSWLTAPFGRGRFGRG